MENDSLQKTYPKKGQPENKSFLRQTFYLIDDCENALKVKKNSDSNSNKQKKVAKIPSHIFQDTNINVQEQELIEKELEKLRKKARKGSQSCCIKKSDLCENQLTFTEAELKKLQIIDEFMQRGLPIPDIDAINSAEEFNCQMEESFIPVIEKSYDNEIENFAEWRKNGNKRKITEEINRQNFDKFMKILPKNDDKEENMKNYLCKFTKNINFQKHNSKFQSKSDFQKRASIKLDEFVRRNHNASSSSALGKISPSLLSQFSSKKYIARLQRKKFPLLQKSSPKINRSTLRMMKNRQKLNQLTVDVSTKYSSFQKSVYMTDERVQGLYECQVNYFIRKVLRRAKAILNHKDYQNLALCYGNDHINEKQNHEESHKKISESNHPLGENFRRQSTRQIDGILSLNKKRLKFERQRIITKLKC